MIRVIGNVAVVHYRLDWEIEDADGSSSTVSYRITHTWLEENGKWRILTGMSSAVATR
jgi:ketosteroid isomerase-like protein